MKIIFEYEDGHMYTIYNLKAYEINQRSPAHKLLDVYLSDPKVQKMYIVADDNYLGYDYPEAKAINEIFEFARTRSQHVLHTI